MKSDSTTTTMKLDDYQSKCHLFDSLLYKGVIYNIGDTITVLSRDQCEYVGKIIKILCYPQQNDTYVPLIEIQWFCLAHDLSPKFEEFKQYFSEYEIFLTSIQNVLFVDSIYRKCQVLTFEQFDNQEQVDQDVYFTRAFYSVQTQELYPGIEQWKKACICNSPINPDILYIQCDQCKEWFHKECIDQQLAKIESEFTCPKCLQETKRRTRSQK